MDNKQSQEQLASMLEILDQMGQPGFLLNNDYCLLSMNQSAMVLHDFEEALDIKDKNYFELCSDDNQLSAAFSKALLKSAKKKKITVLSVVQEKIIEWSIFRFVDTDGKHLYCLLGMDKTAEVKRFQDAQYAAEMAERLMGYQPEHFDSPMPYFKIVADYFQTLLLNIPGFVYWKDKASNYLGCNQNVLDILGLHSLQEIVGKTDYHLASLLGWPKETPVRFIRDDKMVMLEDKPSLNREEEPFSTSTGENIAQVSNRVPMHDNDGNVIGILCNTFDVTEIKEKEAILETALERAEAASRAKSLFISSMSHDLRTPFIGISEMTKQIQARVDDPELKKDLGYVVESSHYLLKFFNEVLEMAQLAQDKRVPEPEKFAIRGLVNEVAGILKAVSEQKQIPLVIKFAKNMPVNVLGCRSYIHRILFNLVANAFKFSQKGQVTIHVKVIKKKRDAILLGLFVEDTGIGIPKEEQQRVFEDFHRLHTKHRRRTVEDLDDAAYQGAGLGLSIVRTFLNRIEGEIELESEEGKGSIFKCFLPLHIPLSEPDMDDERLDSAATEELTAIANKEEAIPLPAYTRLPQLLLVEDDRLCQLVFSNTIQEIGCPLEVVGSAEEALELLKAAPEKYDLIFSDMGLPRMQGLELAQAIRYTLQLRVPIVAVSAQLGIDEEPKCFRSGINEVLIKPATRNDLVKMVKKYYDISE